MSKHTPGPWQIESRGWNGQSIFGHDDRANGRRFIADVSLDYEGAEANANLIKSSPLLLASLEEVLEVWITGISRRTFSETARDAKYAIAQAKGGQS